MNLYFRLLVVLVRNLFVKPIHPMESTVTKFRVMPWDIDAFGHLNNGRYLQIADVARVEWLRRTRILDSAAKNRWGAVLGGNFIRYCKVLRPFQRFTVKTSILSWESRWIFIEHRFENASGDLIAIGYTRAALRSKKRWVTTDQITDAVAPGLQSPVHPPIVRMWLAADDALVDGNDFSHISAEGNTQSHLIPATYVTAANLPANTVKDCANY